MNELRRYDPKWNFKEGTMKELNHQFHPYPAMLMPLIVRELLTKYGKGDKTVVLDPYVGSGTTLVEAQFYGAKKVIGVDLNPLAIMISKAKTIRYNFVKLNKTIDDFKKHSISVDYSINISNEDIHNFSIRDSWFKEKNVIELAFIQQFVDNIEDQKVKLFFMIAFSVVVRSVSMTRNGEFKLYRIPKKKIESFNPEAIKEFIEVWDKNYNMANEYNDVCDFSTDVDIYEMNANELMSMNKMKNSVDIVITSPPYGDSHTTVAYGQFSRLANEWLRIKDANKIDKTLMGGSTKVDLDTKFGIQELDDVINKIRTYDMSVKNKRYPDVISFYIDYIKSIESVATTVKSGGVVIYVVGNRRVRNQ